MKAIKGYRTVIVQVVVALGMIIGIEQSQLGDLPGSVDTVLEAATALWAVANILLRMVTDTPLFKDR